MTAPISNAILAGEDFAVALDKAIEQERDKAKRAALKVAKRVFVEDVMERLDQALMPAVVSNSKD